MRSKGRARAKLPSGSEQNVLKDVTSNGFIIGEAKRPARKEARRHPMAPVPFGYFPAPKSLRDLGAMNIPCRLPSQEQRARRTACCWAGLLGESPKAQCTQGTAQQLRKRRLPSEIQVCPQGRPRLRHEDSANSC